jgi:predicted amidohydrolase
MKFKIALLQLLPKEMDQKFNLKTGIEACHKAKNMGADLALFPEMWNIGYAFCQPDRKKEWEKEARILDYRAGFNL